MTETKQLGEDRFLLRNLTEQNPDIKRLIRETFDNAAGRNAKEYSVSLSRLLRIVGNARYEEGFQRGRR